MGPTTLAEPRHAVLLRDRGTENRHEGCCQNHYQQDAIADDSGGSESRGGDVHRLTDVIFTGHRAKIVRFVQP